MFFPPRFISLFSHSPDGKSDEQKWNKCADSRSVNTAGVRGSRCAEELETEEQIFGHFTQE